MIKGIFFGCSFAASKLLTCVDLRWYMLRVVVTFLFLAWATAATCADETVSVSGITEPIEDVTLSLTVGGTISVISFREGAPVKKGQRILSRASGSSTQRAASHSAFNPRRILRSSSSCNFPLLS